MKFLAALAAVTAAIVAVPGGVVGGTAACAAEENRFAIAVDFGDAPGAPSDTVTCVPVDENDTAADALATRARMLGRPAPRYNNAGLLCSLDGFPESGCGDRTEAGYRYWSYWFGGDKWSYASTGPAFHRAKAGGVIGWRFQPTGTATASDPPPRASARFADLCPPVTVASTPPTSAAPPRSAASTTSPTTAAPVGTPTSASAATSTTAAAPSAAESSTTTSSVSEDDESGEVAAAPEGEGDADGSSWPVAAGGIAVAAAIGGAAVVRARRR